MSLIQQLTPLNLLEEKSKFFADENYNPQFIFAEEIEDSTITQYGTPSSIFRELAKHIVDKAYHDRNEADLFMMEGAVINQAEADEKIKHFLKMHHLEKRIDVVWSSSFVSRASVTSDTLKLRLPPDFRKEGLIGMLYHEIGTHALRRINYEQQPWFRKKKKYGFHSYLLTEEGLAVLHALIPHTFKSLFIGAIRYLAVSYTQEHSFAEVWQYLKPWVQDPERRWNIAFRAKRGLTDTSLPGGFTKDLLYLAGPVEVWQWLSHHQFDPRLLYFGKLGMQDVEKALEMNPHFEPALPSFYLIDPDQYKEDIYIIGKENELDELRF